MRVRSIDFARNMDGTARKGGDYNHHPASHAGGDILARTIGLSCALTPDDAARWGLNFVADFTGQGRGFELKDGKTRAGTGASVKRVSREEWEKATSAVLCCVSAASFNRYGAAVAKGCPVVVVHAPGDTVDLDNLWFAVIDAREVVKQAGGWASIPDVTGQGHPGRGGRGPVWRKQVGRKGQADTYTEVSIKVPRSAWRSGTVEELHAEIDRIG